MNNFDDLFEQQPQPEATEKPEPQKEKPKKQWWQIREEKQRKEAYATLDRVFGAFSEGHGDMKAYLDTQSRFPFHSARNAILIGEQCPNAKRVGGYKEWASQGVEILEEEKRLPIIILEPGKAYRREDGSVGQNFYAKEVFDISQTTARDEAQPQVSYDDRLLLKALISNSPVPIRAVEELPGQGRGAMFDPEQNAILVKKGMDAPDIFRCVSLELANAQLARSNAEYSRETEGYNPQPAYEQKGQKRPYRLLGPGAYAVLLHHHGLCCQRPLDGYQQPQRLHFRPHPGYWYDPAGLRRGADRPLSQIP